MQDGQEQQAVLERVEALERTVAALCRERDAAARKLRRWQITGGAALLALLGFLMPGSPAAAQLSVEERLAAVEQKTNSLWTRFMHVTRNGHNLYITGANLHIRNGEGGTETVNGRGNLILGYGEARPENPDGSDANARTGSHNVVVGGQANYTSYGGIVGGLRNNLLGPYAAVTGGTGNTAEGPQSAVSGGGGNVAAGAQSVVAGGQMNQAVGSWSCVSGGQHNKATDTHAAVSGGYNNLAGAAWASVSGGGSNIISGPVASISGGEMNKATGRFASVTGGRKNSATAQHATVTAGLLNIAQAQFASVSGGEENKSSGPKASISGGYRNITGWMSSSISGGMNLRDTYHYAWHSGGLMPPSGGPGKFYAYQTVAVGP